MFPQHYPWNGRPAWLQSPPYARGITPAYTLLLGFSRFPEGSRSTCVLPPERGLSYQTTAHTSAWQMQSELKSKHCSPRWTCSTAILGTRQKLQCRQIHEQQAPTEIRALPEMVVGLYRTQTTSVLRCLQHITSMNLHVNHHEPHAPAFTMSWTAAALVDGSYAGCSTNSPTPCSCMQTCTHKEQANGFRQAAR